MLRNLALDRSFDINSGGSAFSVVLHSVLSLGKEKPMAVFVFVFVSFLKKPCFHRFSKGYQYPEFLKRDHEFMYVCWSWLAEGTSVFAATSFPFNPRVLDEKQKNQTGGKGSCAFLL